MLGRSLRRALRGTVAAVLGAVLVLGGASAASAAELRMWTDSTSAFKLQASLVRVQGDEVILKREDGQEIQVELKRLSQADQEYAAKSSGNAKSPFELVDEPEREGSDLPLEEVKSDPMIQDGASAAINWSAVEILGVQPPGEWKLTVGKPPQEATACKKVFMCPARRQPEEEATEIVINRTCHRAIIGFKHPRAPEGADTRLVLCDLVDGRITQGIGPGLMIPLALSDRGDQVLMRSDEGHDRTDRLELWSLTPKGVESTAQWRPYESLERGDRNVKWATLLGDTRAVTFSDCGRLVVWQINPLKPLCYLEVDGRCVPAVSPDGRYVVFAADRKACVLDLQGPGVVASQDLPFRDPMVPVFAFSPNGQQLACISRDDLLVLDFATGNVTHALSVKGTIPMGRIAWTDDSHVLVRNITLFNIASQAKVWAYDGIKAMAVADGLCWCVVSGWPKPLDGLVPLRLPHPGIQDIFALADKHPEHFALRPGDTVRLVLDAIPDEKTRKEVCEMATEKLQASGFKVGTDGSIDLVVGSPTSKEVDVPYKSFGHPGVEVHRVRAFSVPIRLVYQGQPVWEVTSSSVPGMVHLEQGQTLEEYLRKCEKPSYGWFVLGEFPRFLTREFSTPLQGMIGHSKVTLSGIEEPQLPASKATTR